MIIAFNARVLNERRGGPYRVTYNILRELTKIDRENIYYILLYDTITLDFHLPDNFILKVVRIKSRVLFDYLYLPLFSYLNKIDVFFFPKNTFSPMVRGKKIPVFHDIVYFENLNFREFKFFDNLHHKIMIPVAAKFSVMNMSVSDFTASRMKELLKIDDRKIRVIKNGVEPAFKKIDDKKILKTTAVKFNLKSPFYFYSGSLSPRKNMINVIMAFHTIRDRVKHNLYFTGGDSWRDSGIYKLIAELKLEGRIIKLGYLTENELVVLYNLADCYLYPSLYEGFGLPILEAQACHCPVITSNAASCPEVAGDSALIVDPGSVKEISDAMLKLASDKKLRNSLVKKGLKNYRSYSWEKSARELLDLFQSCR